MRFELKKLETSYSALKNLATILLTPIPKKNLAYYPRSTVWKWAFWGGIFLIITLIALELRTHYYFVQDDVYATEMPSLIYACRNILLGIWPEWNPHQYLGAPFASMGMLALTYPFTLPCYLFANFILHNEFAVADVFAMIHLLGGYILTFILLRRLNARPWIACLGGLCFSLSGIFLIGGRSWHHLITLSLWLPALMLACHTLFQNTESKSYYPKCNGVIMGLLLACLYHAGFPQFWAYTMLFIILALFIIFFSDGLQRKHIQTLFIAFLVAAALILPLVFLQMDIAADTHRTSGLGNGIGKGLLAMLFPYPFISAEHPEGWGNMNTQYMGAIYYTGTLFVILFFLSVFSLLFSTDIKKKWQQNIYLILGCVAFLIALGKYGFLWFILCKLPLLDKINNYPFRILPFLNLFIVVTGAIAFERLFSVLKMHHVKKIEIFLFIGMLFLLMLHVAACKVSFYQYENMPYPVLPKKLADLFLQNQDKGGYRIFPVAPLRSNQKWYALSLSHSFPSLYGINSFGGYDPLPENKLLFQNASSKIEKNLLQTARAYGIRYFIIYKINPSSLEKNSSSFLAYMERKSYLLHLNLIEKIHDHLTFAFENEAVKVYELDSPEPMAFIEGHPDSFFFLHFNAKGALIVFPSPILKSEKIVVNVLALPHLIAYTENKILNQTNDKWGRVVIDAPAGSKQISLLYQPPYKEVILLTGFIILLSLLISFGMMVLMTD